jgi:hypothetical protein
MQHVADWLEKLGLGQYAQRFAENDINFGILPHLTDQDLKDIIGTVAGRRAPLCLRICRDDRLTALPARERLQLHRPRRFDLSARNCLVTARRQAVRFLLHSVRQLIRGAGSV